MLQRLKRDSNPMKLLIAVLVLKLQYQISCTPLITIQYFGIPVSGVAQALTGSTLWVLPVTVPNR